MGPLPNPRTSGPREFRTVSGHRLPFEWEGYGPKPGDVVERYGIRTGYSVHEMPDEYFTSRIIIAFTESQECFFAGATPDGFYSSLIIGPHDPLGHRHDAMVSYTFVTQGVVCEWRSERITDLQPDGINYFTWDCYAAVPVNAPAHAPSMQSERYRTEMDRRKRVSGNAARHERRAREDARIDRFDPLDVYVRDGWMCQICRSEVNPKVLYPNPQSASLDHVVALSRGGDHTLENTVLAHLRCNLVKAAN